jgi:serine/threonine-protein kinase
VANEDETKQPLEPDDDSQPDEFLTAAIDRDELARIAAEGLDDDGDDASDAPDLGDSDADLSGLVVLDDDAPALDADDARFLVTDREASQSEAWQVPEAARDVQQILPPEEGMRQAEAVPARRGGCGAMVAVVMVILLIVGVAGAFASYGMELWGGRSVPNVAEAAEDRARAALEEKGFRVTVERQVSDGPEGRALGTSPSAGTRVEEGSTIMLYVSLARKIPDVKGMSLDDARHAIEAMGAENFTIEYVASSAREGSVVGVKPEPGSLFAPSDTIVISVAQALTVPYVVGRSEEEAVASLQGVGLVPKVTYKPTDKKGGIVLSANPGQGTKVREGTTVELSVTSYYPSDYRQLARYFACPTSKMAACLAEMGFTLESAYVDEEGRVQARYSSPEKGRLTFGNEPFTTRFDTSHGAGSGIVDASSYRGIRLDFAKDVPASAKDLSDKSLQDLANACGFTGMSERASSATAQFPAGIDPKATPFACGSGRQDGYTWTVLIVREGSGVRAAATCAPTSLYDEHDLSEFGGSVCSFAAYADICVR